MNNFHHAEEVLRRVLTARPWLANIGVQHAKNARYVRVFKFAPQVTLQVLYGKGDGGTFPSLEVAIVFDDNGRNANVRALQEFREDYEDDEVRLGIKARDGEGGKAIYLGKFFALVPTPEFAYDQATELCLEILDLGFGGRAVREQYGLLRDNYLKQKSSE
jgi:hypothetical protein